jgi:uncharacterized coiled-coil protein SlyX
MNRADEMVPKRETSQPQTNGVAAGSFDNLREQLHAVFNKFEDPSHQAKPVDDLHGSDHRLDEPLRTRLKNFQRPSPQPMPEEEDGPVERDDLRPGITSYPDHEASERQANYDLSIENKMTRRSSRGFARYLVAILIGVAATLAWQSYGKTTKQIIATRAPELGWSPETKQMIANSIHQLGWTKPPVVESKAAAVAQTAPATPPIDAAQVQQMARDLATLRQTVERLAAGLDQVTREIGKLEAADVEILAKITPAPPPPRPAPARKPTPTAPPSSSTPITPPTSLAPTPPPDE